MFGNGGWIVANCDSLNNFICAKPPHMRSGNHRLVYRNTSLAYPTFHFWWNHTPDRSDNEKPGFKLLWHIENGTVLDIRELVSEDLLGRVSTPGLGEPAPPDYYNEVHEYNIVIELPKSSPNGTLAVDVDVKVQQEGSLELLTAEQELVFYNISTTWLEAEEFCASEGGHLASVVSRHQYQRLKAFIEPKGLVTEFIWLGGTDGGIEGEWTWSDGSKWSVGYWMQSEPSNLIGQNCMVFLYDSAAEFCYRKYPFICNLPVKKVIKADSQLLFTSENISSGALQFTWVSQPTSHRNKSLAKQSTSFEGNGNASLLDVKEKLNDARTHAKGGFTIQWQVKGSDMNTNMTKEGYWAQKFNQKSDGRQTVRNTQYPTA